MWVGLTTAATLYFVAKDSLWTASLTRLPDALISAFCLGLFGYSTMRNFLSHRRRYWAAGAVLIALFYGFIQVVYAANPVWAKWQESEIQKVLDKARYRPKPDDPVDYLDSALFAVALPLKMLLFVPAFYLFFTLIIAAHDFRKVLRVVREQKKSYFSSDGIVQAIGQSVSANSVKVFIKLPGTELPAAWFISWPDNTSGYIVLDPKANPSVDRRLLKVLDGDVEIPVHNSGEWQQRIDHPDRRTTRKGRHLRRRHKIRGPMGVLQDGGAGRRLQRDDRSQGRSEGIIAKLRLVSLTIYDAVDVN